MARHVIETNIKPSQILDLMDKYPKVFFALSFSGENFVLKIKAKAPKSGNPGKDGEKPIVDFCSLKTEDEDMINELFFDVENFKEISVNHTINVIDIIYPNNIDELKPAEIRELSKRKGTIKRIANIDGVEKITESEFII